ncbi:MAG TPA: amidohydrolase [Ornithinibacter sp.]|nr:amidohydrolase [Ornithinibacter sp.]
MTRVRIENATYLLTVDPTDQVLRNATIHIEDGIITAVTTATVATDAHERTEGPEPEEEQGSRGRPMDGSGGSAGVRAAGEGADGLRPPPESGSAGGGAEPTPADVVVLDARGKLVMPGLVNLHTHLPLTLLRGVAEDVDLQGFLTRVWAAEGAVMDPDTVELGATLGSLESLLGGCTTQLDMYFHHEASHRGAVAAGSRHVIGPVFFDGPGPDGLAWDARLANLRAWPGLLDEIGGPRVPVSAMPHATYTCSPDGFAEVVTILRELLADTDRPGMLTTHVSENAAENDGIRERYAATPTELLARAGWVERDLPLVVGHGVHLSETDRQVLADGGAAVGHCPGSNLKLASGALPWEALRDSGIRLGIGTDGCSSSNDLDMWQAMRQAALLARLTSGRPDVASATEVLRAATIEGARALGLGDEIGSVEVGKRADLVLLDLNAPHLTPVHDVAALLVFAAGRGDVTDVLVDGEVVVRSRRSTRLDTADLLARATARGEVARAAAEAP